MKGSFRTTFHDTMIDSWSRKSYKLEPHRMTQGLTLRVKGLQVRTTLYESRFDSESERVAS